MNGDFLPLIFSKIVRTKIAHLRKVEPNHKTHFVTYNASFPSARIDLKYCNILVVVLVVVVVIALDSAATVVVAVDDSVTVLSRCLVYEDRVGDTVRTVSLVDNVFENK